MNAVVLTGRLGTDPELKEAKGKKYMRFRLAVKKNGSGTLWVTVVSFDSTAESAAKVLKKGGRIVLRGRLDADKNGNLMVVAYEIEAVDRSPKPAKTKTKPPEPEEDEIIAEEDLLPPEDDDEVPF